MSLRTAPFVRVTLTDPATPVLSVAEVKAHLRINFPDDDAWLALAVEAASEAFEKQSAKPLRRGQFSAAAPGFPDGSEPFYLPLGGVWSVLQITYWQDGVQSVLDPANYTLEASAVLQSYTHIYPAGGGWPIGTDPRGDAVFIVVDAGLPLISAMTKQHLLAAVAELYFEREQTADATDGPSLAAALAALDGGMRLA